MIDNAKVTEALARLRARDPKLGEELKRHLDRPAPVLEGLNAGSPMREPGITLETIVLRTGRPVLAIAQDDVSIGVLEADSEVWRARLDAAKAVLHPAIRAVGRIELEGHPDFSWVGTGWLVRPDIVVTNRHVGQVFGRRNGDGFVFRIGTGQKPMLASIDFLEEVNRPERRSFRLREIISIEDDDGPDLTFLRIEPGDLAAPIRLASQAANQDQQVAIVGYPARDSRIPDVDLMERIFGNVYDKKRLAPGQITTVASGEVQHDCSTLGGNSGSVVLDLATGNALGIHFAGRFLQANFAVPADVIDERLRRAELGGARPSNPAATRPDAVVSSSTPPPNLAVSQGLAAAGAGRIEYTIPIKVTIELGGAAAANVAVGAQPMANVAVGAGSANVAVARPSASVAASAVDTGDDDGNFAAEARPADYANRKGYQSDFLGDSIEVALPKVVRDKDDILTFEFGGNSNESVLRYHHYSVVMNGKRRMCFFSAVNINGKQSRRTKRGGWQFDPRIPKDRQILKECYGNAPKFARGHMTRREDPAWGTEDQAQAGNADSMHATNITPQMQTFNGGIWLGLEDYALQNAREDDMRICVFTGPVLRVRDPVMYGVKIPIMFWKVLAFVHDKTGKLSATGYSISQQKFLQPEEFVFGAYETHQRSLKWIEEAAGVSFGRLTSHDRFEDSDEATERPLAAYTQIKF